MGLICSNYLNHNHNISDIFHNHSVVIYAYKNYVMDSVKVMVLLNNVVSITQVKFPIQMREEANW